MYNVLDTVNDLFRSGMIFKISTSGLYTLNWKTKIYGGNIRENPLFVEIKKFAKISYNLSLCRYEKYLLRKVIS